MRAAAKVQHLAGDLARLGEIEHGLRDVLGTRNMPEGRQCAQEFLGTVLVQRRIHNAWSDHVHANALRRVFHRETSGDRVDAALGDHRDGRGHPGKRMIDDGSGDAHHAAAALLRKHLLYGRLRRMDEAIQVGRRQRPEVLERVPGERLRKEDPRVVHQGVDRAEPLYRGSNDHLGRRGQTDVAVHQGQLVRALQLGLLTDLARVAHYVVAAIEEQVGNRGTDPLRRSRHDDGLLFASHANALSGCALRLIRWESPESNFQKWQSDRMTNLDDVLIFVKVAQFESISRAARSLAMPISTVSRRLSVLESKLGVSLLRRTTRRVTLTGQGREYFNQCREPLTLLEEAERVLTLGQRVPEGMLRISVPVILGHEPFLDFLSGFLKTQPRIRLDLYITNLFLDLVAENIDVAIRFGELEDSSVVATRIGTSIRYVVAAAEYLKRRKLPVEPADLKLHDCVMLNARNNEADWDLVYGRKKARIRVSGPISSRDFNSVSTFVYRGHGIGLLPSTYCDEALASGALKRLLPKWASPQIPLFAVYSNRKFRPLRLNIFLEALAAWKSPLWLRE